MPPQAMSKRGCVLCRARIRKTRWVRGAARSFGASSQR